jgi:hypothetical protein
MAIARPFGVSALGRSLTVSVHTARAQPDCLWGRQLGGEVATCTQNADSSGRTVERFHSSRRSEAAPGTRQGKRKTLRPKGLGRVGDTGFEPSSADIGAAFRSHRCRVDLSTGVRFCITDQASVTMLSHWSHMGNTQGLRIKLHQDYWVRV